VTAVPRDWDGEDSLLVRDPPTGAWFAIAIHSTRLGPAVGGTRLRAYESPEEALADARRLAAAMTLKFAVPGLPWGGGKGVIAVPPDLSRAARPGLLRRYGALVASLGGRYRTAPDAGTSSEDMDVIAETAGPWVFGRTPAAGGAGPSGPATAVGVLAAVRAACAEAFGAESVAGRRVLVQGAGSVGGTLLRLLREEGADTLVSEVDEAVLSRVVAVGTVAVRPDAVAGTSCDVFAPCAFGGVVTAATLPRLACRVIAGGANNQLGGEGLAGALAARGILYAPDFVANAGGAMAGVHMEADGWTREQAETEVTDRIGAALRAIFAIAREHGVDTDTAARRLALARLEAAPRRP
jgi:leucine dehydrogenase